MVKCMRTWLQSTQWSHLTELFCLTQCTYSNKMMWLLLYVLCAYHVGCWPPVCSLCFPLHETPIAYYYTVGISVSQYLCCSMKAQLHKYHYTHQESGSWDQWVLKCHHIPWVPGSWRGETRGLTYPAKQHHSVSPFCLRHCPLSWTRTMNLFLESINCQRRGNLILYKSNFMATWMLECI